MSVQAISWVLDHSQARGNARLVLIAVANHADSRGRNAFASLGLLAREAGLGRRTVRRLINETLVPSGELAVSRRQAGTTTVYELPALSTTPAAGGRGTPAKMAEVADGTPASGGPSPPANGGLPPRPMVAGVSEPYVNRQVEPGAGSASLVENPVAASAGAERARELREELSRRRAREMANESEPRGPPASGQSMTRNASRKERER